MHLKQDFFYQNHPKQHITQLGWMGSAYVELIKAAADL